MKKIIPILFTSALLLTGVTACKDNTPKLNSLTITNKTELTAAWYLGGRDRTVTIQSDPELKSKEWGPSGHLRLSVSDPEILTAEGAVLTPSSSKAGEVTVAVTYYGISYDSFTVTIGDLAPEPEVIENKTLQEIITSTVTEKPVQRYKGTYTVNSVAYDQYGNMTIVDDSLDAGASVKVYGCSYNMNLTWQKPGEYDTAAANPRDFLSHLEGKDDLVDIEPGDTITGVMLPFLYNKTDFEVLFKIERFTKATRDQVTAIAVNPTMEITQYSKEKIEVTTTPAGGSKLFEFSIPAEADKEFITVDKYTGEVSALKAGTGTVKVVARKVTGVEATVTVTVNPYIDNGIVETPTDGLEAAIAVVKSTGHMYYDGEVKSTYYGNVTTDFDEAEMDFLRAGSGDNAGKWAIQRPANLTGENEKYAGKYIGIQVSGNYINFKWDLAEPMYGTWSDELQTIVFHIGEKDYIIASQSTYASLSGCEIAKADGNQYFGAHFHTTAA